MLLKSLGASLYVLSILYLTDGSTQLDLFPGLQCSYNYDLQVHTHRGERSTKELNFKINVKVCIVCFFRVLLKTCSQIVINVCCFK